MDFYKAYTSTQALGGSDPELQLRVAEDNLKINFLPHFPQNRQTKIIDVACGYGRYLKALAELGYSNVQGVDLSEEQIAYSVNTLGLSCTQLTDGLRYLEERPETFDVVLLIDILEHLSSTENVGWIAAAYRALRPGGVILIQVPNGLAPFSVHFYGDVTHQRAYSVSMLAQCIRLAGCNSHSFYPAFAAPSRVVGILRFLLWRYILNPGISLLVKVMHGTTAGGVFTANIIGKITKEHGK